MGRRFLGPAQLSAIAEDLGIASPLARMAEVPAIPFKKTELIRGAGDYLLILGIDRNVRGEPLTLATMRDFFGTDPVGRQPCFYNQDWYLAEHFASEVALDLRWYFLRTSVLPSSRGKDPESVKGSDLFQAELPLAVLCAFAFFANYFHTEGEVLWENDFLWCADVDHNGDRIYAGRYTDPSGVNKSGFNIHRHLRIRDCYGVADASHG